MSSPSPLPEAWSGPLACGFVGGPPLTSVVSKPSVRPSFRLPSIFRALGSGFHGAPTLLRLSPWWTPVRSPADPVGVVRLPACSRSPDPARKGFWVPVASPALRLAAVWGFGLLRPRTRSRAPPVAAGMVSRRGQLGPV